MLQRNWQNWKDSLQLSLRSRITSSLISRLKGKGNLITSVSFPSSQILFLHKRGREFFKKESLQTDQRKDNFCKLKSNLLTNCRSMELLALFSSKLMEKHWLSLFIGVTHIVIPALRLLQWKIGRNWRWKSFAKG